MEEIMSIACPKHTTGGGPCYCNKTWGSEYSVQANGRLTMTTETQKQSETTVASGEASEFGAVLASIITPEQKEIVQNNINDYMRNGCVMSKHSLDIIQKLLDAC
jgi:hypothetical protein